MNIALTPAMEAALNAPPELNNPLRPRPPNQLDPVAVFTHTVAGQPVEIRVHSNSWDRIGINYTPDPGLRVTLQNGHQDPNPQTLEFATRELQNQAMRALFQSSIPTVATRLGIPVDRLTINETLLKTLAGGTP